MTSAKWRIEKELGSRYEKERPKLLVGSPECNMFSVLQRLSPWTVDKAKKLLDAKAHMRFVCELYREQVEDGNIQ